MYECKSIPIEIKADTGKRIFEGYASTWKKDLVNDQIVKGAFTKTIDERFTQMVSKGMKSKIKVLYQHGDPLGFPIHMEEDSNGLYVKAQISKTQLGNDVLELMQDGVVDEMSIGYKVLQDEYAKEDDTRFLKELKLFEFSPVTFGANPYTSITQVKSLINESEVERLERMIKAGRIFSKPNLERLRQAQSHLAELLALMEEQQEEPKRFTQTDLKSIHKLLTEGEFFK